MAEIIGKLDPEVLKQRMEQTTAADPKFIEFVREERKRRESFDVARKKKRIEAKRVEKQVMSGRFNHVKITEE